MGCAESKDTITPELVEQRNTLNTPNAPCVPPTQAMLASLDVKDIPTESGKNSPHGVEHLDM